MPSNIDDGTALTALLDWGISHGLTTADIKGLIEDVLVTFEAGNEPYAIVVRRLLGRILLVEGN